MKQLTDELKYKYICNCSVLVEMNGVKLLVDGLIWDDSPFDKTPKDIEQDIISASGEFEGLKTLLFTHCHEDHFCSKKTADFLENNPDALVAVPDMSWYDGASQAEKEAFAEVKSFVRHDYETGVLNKHRKKIVNFTGETGEVKTLDINQKSSEGKPVAVEYMKTGHLTFDYPEHYAVNIIGESSNVILTADMDLLNMDILKNFTMKEHSFVFMNNIFLWHRSWRNTIESMGFEKVFIYHTPKEENDSLGYRRKATKCWERYRDKYPGWEALNIDEVH